MSPELAWPLLIVGICAVWVGIVEVAAWLDRRRQRDPDHCDCIWCSQARDHARHPH